MFRELFSRWKQPKTTQTSTPEFMFSKEPRRLVAVGSEKKSGAFARVYDSEIPGMVVKRGSTIRDGYILWLSYILEHGPNPLFPKVYAIHVDRRLGEFWVLMERLESQPIPTRGYDDPRIKGDRIYHYDGKVSDADHNTIRQVLLWLDERGLYADLHANNWMMRGDQPVMTDPVSETCGDLDDSSSETIYLKELEAVCQKKNLTLLTFGD